ncbi:MAG: bifunctional demethylmenaquinone methyltransferase/2-methoxy-6-polyprenyl-1,4-benzoquinol methylase UbiE [Endomicrobiales bacterium]
MALASNAPTGTVPGPSAVLSPMPWYRSGDIVVCRAPIAVLIQNRAEICYNLQYIMNAVSDKATMNKDQSWKLFDKINRSYDFLNHLFSFGMDRIWRKRIGKFLPASGDLVLLDAATGTGDVIFTLVKNNGAIRKAYGIDMSVRMLEEADKKLGRHGAPGGKIVFSKADMNTTPFPDDTFDVITISFGIRNVSDPKNALKEMYRVLKNKGKVIVMEFSIPGNRLVRLVYLFYLRDIIPFLGKLFSRDAAAYSYLNTSIEAFPYGQRFRAILEDAGFRNVSFHPQTWGVSTIYVGEKTDENQN